MLTLGIESTCDETSCSVLLDGETILSNVIFSQNELHAKFGGVFPELASRGHVDAFIPVLKQALEEAKIDLDEIDLIAVANGPGLIGSLLTGLHLSKGLAFSLNIPIVGVNHLEAHLHAVFIGQKIPLPSLGLILSGGHTSLHHLEDLDNIKLLGQTQDDAVGEAFDKVATLLGLPYPGGPEIEKLGATGNPLKYSFKTGQIEDRPFDFSFSGLKTAVLYLVKGQNGDKHSPLKISEEEKRDVAASFQRAAFTAIYKKILLAAKETHCHSVIIGGGVSQNLELRRFLGEKLSHMQFFWPKCGLSSDNAAMIAKTGFHKFQKGGKDDLLNLEAKPNLKAFTSSSHSTSSCLL